MINQPDNSILTNPSIQTLLGEEEYNKVLGEINADLKEEEKVRSSFSAKNRVAYKRLELQLRLFCQISRL